MNILLTSITGETRYLETEEGANAHASWQLYLKNKDYLDENGNFANTVDQTEFMQNQDRAADVLVGLLGTLPEGKEKAIVNMLASDVGLLFAIGSGQFSIEELCEWARSHVSSSMKLGFYETWLGRKIGFYEKLYETITDAYDKLTDSQKKHQDTSDQSAGKAVFLVDYNRLKCSVEEFAAMEAELGRISSRLEAVSLPGQLRSNAELNHTLKALYAEVKAEQNSMKQMREVLEASIQCYGETERRLVSRAV